MPEIAAKPRKCFRVLHTADWHLGKFLNDQSREEEHRLFLEWLLAVVNENDVDAIVLAGDVFDSANPSQSALSLYYNFASSLHKQGACSLVIIAGNHDSAAQLESPKQVLGVINTHVVGFLAEKPEDRILFLPDTGNPQIAIALIPFLRDRDLRIGRAGESADEIRKQILGGIEKRYQEVSAYVEKAQLACPVLATGHLTVLGARKSDSEREIHIGGLGSTPPEIFPETFSYVALGHLHRPQAVGTEERIRYSGSPIPLSFSEAEDEKEVRIVDFANDGISQHGLPVPKFRCLRQLRVKSAELEVALRGFKPDSGALKTWVEVVIEDVTFQDDLNERVKAVAEDRDFEVLKVLLERVKVEPGASAENTSDEEVLNFLDDPKTVFERLLEQREGIQKEEAENLKAAFAVLFEKNSQNEGEPATIDT